MDNMSDDDHPAPAPVEVVSECMCFMFLMVKQDDEFYQAAQEAQQRKRKQKAADKEASKYVHRGSWCTNSDLSQT